MPGSSFSRLRGRRPMGASVLAVTVAILAFGPAAVAADLGGGELTVMTRNLYFGTDLTPVIAAPTPSAFVTRVAAAFNQALASDFAGRAKAWADDIERTRPDLVGLQEAVLWRTQTPADFSPVPNATTVAVDTVQLLLAELRSRGLKYEVVIAQTGYDVEAPGLFAGGSFVDVRLTQREVILARKPGALKLTNVQGGQYAARLTVTTAVGASVSLPWAWASVDVSFKGHSFRFATNHLDPLVGPFQQSQANEFLAGPGATTLPIVWVGDFNSDAEATLITGVPPATATYGNIIASGFSDAWRTAHPADPGFTCCQATDLLNPTSTLTQRIDLVLTRGPFDVGTASIIGGTLGDRLPSGLWPSDHAGLVVTLDIPDIEDAQ